MCVCNPGAGGTVSSLRVQGSHSLSIQGPVSFLHIHTHYGAERGSGVVFHRPPFTHPHRSTVACIRSRTHTQTAIVSCEWVSFTYKPLSLFSVITLRSVRSLQSELEHSCYSMRDIWIEYYPLHTLNNRQTRRKTDRLAKRQRRLRDPNRLI